VGCVSSSGKAKSLNLRASRVNAPHRHSWSGVPPVSSAFRARLALWRPGTEDARRCLRRPFASACPVPETGTIGIPSVLLHPRSTPGTSLLERDSANETGTGRTPPKAFYRIDKLGVTGSSPVPPITKGLQNTTLRAPGSYSRPQGVPVQCLRILTMERRRAIFGAGCGLFPPPALPRDAQRE
jgi:hypothetical protein